MPYVIVNVLENRIELDHMPNDPLVSTNSVSVQDVPQPTSFLTNLAKVSVDFKQACDSIDRGVLYNIMLKFDIPTKLRRRTGTNALQPSTRIGYPINGYQHQRDAEKRRGTSAYS